MDYYNIINYFFAFKKRFSNEYCISRKTKASKRHAALGVDKFGVHY
jgi:hypothetical protein